MGFFGLSSKKAKKPELALDSRPMRPDPMPPWPTTDAQPQRQLLQFQPPRPQEFKDAFQYEQPDFRPAGFLPAPPGWSPPPALPPQFHHQAPIVVNQHYYFPSAPPPPPRPGTAPQRPYENCALSGAISKLQLGSVAELAANVVHLPPPQLFDDGLPSWHAYGSQLLNQSAAVCDQVATIFNDVITMVDMEKFCGNEDKLFALPPSPAPTPQLAHPQPTTSTDLVHLNSKPDKKKKDSSGGGGKDHRPKKPKGQTTATAAASVVSGDSFAKVELYANSKLPMNLPPLRLYVATWPILCLAAQFAERVYEKPRGAERDFHVNADWRSGSKAMCIKSVPMDHMDTIVFAIRGTSTFMDWAVNLNMAPTSPTGFLDDPGNFCHAGFLSVARKMIVPVAQRLRRLLEEDPSRTKYSLLLTGHSAGGAIAALLYSHMLGSSPQAASDLSRLASRFKRIHCVTFGTPPVSLLPLTTPRGLRKSLFLSFVNEGDPVARADKAYVKSLLELFAAPPPKPLPQLAGSTAPIKGKSSKSTLLSSKTKSSSSSSSSRNRSKSSRPIPEPGTGPVWKVPPCALSNAGRIVVLRSGDPRARLKGKKTVAERLAEGVVAQTATDEQLRGVIWGDPVAHVMRLYAGRIETLAVGAVTAQSRRDS